MGINANKPEDLLKTIREHDTENDWTYKKTDKWMLGFCKNIIEESEKLKADCEKYGFYYFNTFNDRTFVLNQICDKIKNLQYNN